MINFIRKQGLKLSAAIIVGSMAGAEDVLAAPDLSATNSGGEKTFSTISNNITTSIADLPGLLTGVSYMMGILLGVLGILKIKDHVENPTQTPLQHGAIRLTAGGGLFALPIVFEAMQGSIGNGNGPAQIEVDRVGIGKTFTLN